MSDEALKYLFGLLASIFAGIRWLMHVNYKQSKENISLRNELTTRSISEMRNMVSELMARMDKSDGNQKAFELHLDQTVIDIKKANEQTITTVQEYTFATEKKLKLFEGRLSEIVELGKDVFMVKGPKKDGKKV